jgi:hypothetical protein
MPKKPKQPKNPTDPNLLARSVVEAAIGQSLSPQSPISAYLAEIGRKGGLKGGKARAAKLSSSRRTQIAKKAALSRWSKKD